MSVIKIKNEYNLTTEQVRGIPVEYRQDDNEPISLGTFTHADENYLYATYNGNEDLIIEFNKSVSMELRGDNDV